MKAIRMVVCVLACLVLASPAFASSFVNGNFDIGDFAGWTLGGGYWSGG